MDLNGIASPKVGTSKWPERIKKRIIFATNHRSGSAALRNILLPEVGEKNMFNLGVVDGRFVWRSDNKLKETSFTYDGFLEVAGEDLFSIYYGHFCYGVHQHIPSDCIYFTSVRDPMERVLSAYDLSVQLTGVRIDFKTWLDSTMEAKNGMVKRFCGFGSHETKHKFFDFNRNIPMASDIEINEGHLQKALEVIENYYGFIFLQSHMPENLVILRNILGSRPLFSPVFQRSEFLSNISRGAMVSEELKALIKNYNHFDELLYLKCKENYLNFVNKQDEVFRKEVQVMSLIEQIVAEPDQAKADINNVFKRLDKMVSFLVSVGNAAIAVQIISYFNMNPYFTNSSFAHSSIKVIKEIGTDEDLEKEVKNYIMRFGRDDFISGFILA